MRWFVLILLMVGACRSGGQAKVEGVSGRQLETSRTQERVDREYVGELPPAMLALVKLRGDLDRYGFQVAWYYDFREKIRRLYYVRMDKSLHRLYLETEGNVLYRLDPRSGRVIWQCTFEGPLVFKPVPFDYEDEARRKAIEERLARLEVTDIEEAKRLTTELGRFPPECVVVVGNTLYCLDDSSGQILWKRVLDFALSCPPIVGFGYVYVVNWQRRLYALRKKDRVFEWDILLEGDVIGGGFYKKAHLYVADSSGKVYCIDGGNGDIVWEFRTLDRVLGAPNGWYIKMYVGSFDGFLYSINAEAGFETWKFACQWPIVTRPVAIGRVVYAISEKKGRRMIFAIDKSKGEMIWRQRSCEMVLLQGREWRGRAHTYILDSAGNIRCLLTLSPVVGEVGEVRWRFPVYKYGFEYFVTNPSDIKAIKKNLTRRCIYMATRFGLVVAIEEMPRF